MSAIGVVIVPGVPVDDAAVYGLAEIHLGDATRTTRGRCHLSTSHGLGCQPTAPPLPRQKIKLFSTVERWMTVDEYNTRAIPADSSGEMKGRDTVLYTSSRVVAEGPRDTACHTKIWIMLTLYTTVRIYTMFHMYEKMHTLHYVK